MKPSNAWRTPPSLAQFCREALSLMRRAADGRRALQAIEQIVATDRWNSFDRFRDTTKTLVALYEDAGARAEVYSVQTGGRLGTGRWIIHEAADVRAATAEIVAPIQEPLLGYVRNPWHVVQWSAATPEEGLLGDLVVIDTQEELAALPEGALTGRIVLTRLHLYQLWWRFTEKGAAGIITDCPVSDLPEATVWMKFGWGARPMGYAAANLVGLVLSQREGERLRGLPAPGSRLPAPGTRHPAPGNCSARWGSSSWRTVAWRQSGDSRGGTAPVPSRRRRSMRPSTNEGCSAVVASAGQTPRW